MAVGYQYGLERQENGWWLVRYRGPGKIEEEAQFGHGGLVHHRGALYRRPDSAAACRIRSGTF